MNNKKLYEQELLLAIRLAQGATKKIQSIYHQAFTVMQKEDRSPLTVADQQSNDYIVSEIRRAFPADAIISEEEPIHPTATAQPRIWYIDPLDGTKEFIKKNGEFSVNIGLVVEGVPVLGVIAVPEQNQLYYAQQSQGAYCIDITGHQKEVELAVSSRTFPLNLLISRSHPSAKTKDMIATNEHLIQKITPCGSSYKGCLIAAGIHDAYYNFGTTMKWDTCAMEAIVAEAGGLIKTLEGTAITYVEQNMKNHGFYIVNDKDNIFINF